jgi:hypothetical protein
MTTFINISLVIYSQIWEHRPNSLYSQELFTLRFYLIYDKMTKNGPDLLYSFYSKVVFNSAL